MQIHTVCYSCHMVALFYASQCQYDTELFCVLILKLGFLINSVYSMLKQRELEQEITSVHHSSPLLLPSASLPVFLSGFHHHWRHVHLIH